MTQDNIELDDDILKGLTNTVYENTKALINEKHTNMSLIQAATGRGMKVLKGDISKQNIIDLCSIALTLYMQNKKD